MDNAFGRMSVVAQVGDERDTLELPAGETPAGAGFAPAPEKYEVLAPIGRGGMGEVLLVRDRDLLRDVAMKLLRADVPSADMRRRFVAEAQATSQLDHPGIPPVYDIGLAADGRCYYSMKLVRGRSLASVVAALAAGDADAAAEYDVHRLVTILERVAEAVHFAHEKGVIHRDLKPENVMLGAYGEVLVVDWGIAKVEGVAESGTAVQTAESLAARATRMGTVKGTIPFMSPEQSFGQKLDRRSDVYALGAILYELLTLEPAFEGDEAIPMLLRVARGEFTDVASRNPARPVHEFLAALCRRAMAKDPARRPPSARAFAGELRSYLNGRAESERRHREAEALAAQGREAMARYVAAKASIAGLDRDVAETASRFKPWQSLAEKRPLQDARARLTAARRSVALALAETTKLLEAAVVAEPGNATARSLLADLWRGRLEEAESRAAGDDAAHAVTMLGRYDDGRLAALVAGDGSLDLTSDPPGARVALVRFEDRGGVLVAGPERDLGVTPLAQVPLPMGSYLLLLRHEGFRDVRYPVHVTRNRRWTGRVRLRTDAEIGEGFVLVPGGPYVCGEGKETCIADLPDFAIAASPVTFADWAGFMTEVEEERGLPEATRFRLEVPIVGTFMVRSADGRWLPNPEFFGDEPLFERHGRDYALRLPASGVSWHDAVAYCEWRTRTTGREWRLQGDWEREKAARGVDGRRYPWGDLDDASLCKCQDSRPEPTQPEPVGSFPASTSIYGMMDAAGGGWEWTGSLFDPHRPDSAHRVIRSGSWDNPVNHARSAIRGRYEPEARFSHLGFRVARSLAP